MLKVLQVCLQICNKQIKTSTKDLKSFVYKSCTANENKDLGLNVAFKMCTIFKIKNCIDVVQGHVKNGRN